MDRLHLMAVFVAVCEEESFAGGARRLGLSAPATTRAIAELEARLGIKLLHRTTRHVRVTEAGLRYLEDARRILAEVEEADEAAAGINAAPRGLLTVTAPVLFGRLYVMPGIVEFLRLHPDTQVSALLLDRVVNLLEEGVDVAVRIGALADSSLRAIAVGQVRRLVCASPAYLQAHGSPQHPAELAHHSLITTDPAEWRLAEASPRLRPRLGVNNNDAAIAAAEAGLGLTQRLSYQVADRLADGRLQEVLADYGPPPLPVHIVHRESRFGSAKVRGFIDLLAARLRADSRLHAV